MKIPTPKDEYYKGMMSGSSTGRKKLIHELRETSLMGGNAVQRLVMVDKAVQFKSSMDLGSGDTTNYVFDNSHSYDSYGDGFQLNSHQSNELPIKAFTGPLTSSLRPPSPSLSPSTPPLDKFESSSSSESVNNWSINDKSDSDPLFKGTKNKSTETKDSTLAVVEESRRPNIRANESNPTVPLPKEPSKTSTLRLSDRQRFESEDDIEKVDDPEPGETILEHKALHKTKAITEDSQSSEKMDKNGNRPDPEQNEVDNDCIVECLYYTIQCCECVTF